MSDIEVIKTSLLEQIANAEDAKALDEARVAALGKKGQITELLKTLGSMPMEERVSFGKKINVVKAEIEAKITEKKQELETKQLNEKLKKEVIDVTLPCRPETQGRIHPVSKVYEEIVAIFVQMGFEVAEGPDIEDQFHNFNALNMPPNHPAAKCRTRSTSIMTLIRNLIWTPLMWSGRIRPAYKSVPWKRSSRQSAL